MRYLLAAAWLLLAGLPLCAAPPKSAEKSPSELDFQADKLAEIDAAVEAALQANKMPGCVVVVGRKAGVAWRKAYGQKRLEPLREPMTMDTVFDLASLTKPLATGLVVMTLIEEGKLKLDDSAAKHWPEFAAEGKEGITLEHLLLHTGGLIPDNAMSDYAAGPEKAWERIAGLKPRDPPGGRFVYSDVSFQVLGKIAERVSGTPLDRLARERIYQPLGLAETGYLPSEALRERAAPAERREGKWMQGEVHDPRAFALGGVAGHAGLFSTADNLSVLAATLLGRGEYGGVRIMKEETWKLMTTSHDLPPSEKSAGRRCLGWDMQTGFSSNRGKTFSPAAFGHGGFTGTSLWIDPERDLFVLFLSNRVHPDGKGAVNPLCGQIGTIAADALK